MKFRPAKWCFPFTVWLYFQMFAVLTVNADPADSETNLPGIALIIDDLGNQRELGMRAVKLPGPVACAFLPYGPFTKALASQAHSHRKEIMLHLPMQAVDHGKKRVEEGTLTMD